MIESSCYANSARNCGPGALSQWRRRERFCGVRILKLGESGWISDMHRMSVTNSGIDDSNTTSSGVHQCSSLSDVWRWILHGQKHLLLPVELAFWCRLPFMAVSDWSLGYQLEGYPNHFCVSARPTSQVSEKFRHRMYRYQMLHWRLLSYNV